MNVVLSATLHSPFGIFHLCSNECSNPPPATLNIHILYLTWTQNTKSWEIQHRELNKIKPILSKTNSIYKQKVFSITARPVCPPPSPWPTQSWPVWSRRGRRGARPGGSRWRRRTRTCRTPGQGGFYKKGNLKMYHRIFDSSVVYGMVWYCKVLYRMVSYDIFLYGI